MLQTALLVIELHYSGASIGVHSWKVLADWTLDDFDAMQAIYEKMKGELEQGG